MELKHIFDNLDAKFVELLIVPYGIETAVFRIVMCIRIKLLIVPYGIETSRRRRWTAKAGAFNRTLWN